MVSRNDAAWLGSTVRIRVLRWACKGFWARSPRCTCGWLWAGRESRGVSAVLKGRLEMRTPLDEMPNHFIPHVIQPFRSSPRAARQFNGILRSNLLQNPSRLNFDLSDIDPLTLTCPGTNPQGPPIASIVLWRLLRRSPRTGWYSASVERRITRREPPRECRLVCRFQCMRFG